MEERETLKKIVKQKAMLYKEDWALEEDDEIKQALSSLKKRAQKKY